MQPVIIKPLNLGLVTMDSPVLPRPGSALDTWDMRYESGGSMHVREGVNPFVLNPPAAYQLATFETGDPGITGGSADTSLYFPNDVNGNVKTRSRSAQIGGGTPVVNIIKAWTPAPSIQNEFRQRYICFWMYLSLVSGSKDAADIEMLLYASNSAEGSGFQKTLTHLERVCWNKWVYVAVRMEEFEDILGYNDEIPSWNTLTDFTFQSKNNAPTLCTVKVNIDNFYQGPSAVMALHQLKRSPFYGSDSYLYAYAEKAIHVADFENNRWLRVCGPNHLGLSDASPANSHPGFTQATQQGPRGHFITYSNRAWFCNGIDRPVQILGGLPESGEQELWFYASPTPPAFDLQVDDAGAGNVLLAGDYNWCFTWYNETTGKESAPKPLSDVPTLIASSGSRKYTVTRGESPITGEGSTHWIVYRRDPGSGIYRRTGDQVVADAALDPTGFSIIPISVTSMTDNIPLERLGLDLGTEDHLPIPIVKAMVEMSGSVVAIGTGENAGTVYWSKDGFAEAWGLENYQVLGAAGSTQLLTIKGYAGRVWAGSDDDWYEGVPISQGDWLFQARRTGAGPMSHDGCQVGRGFLMYPGNDGMYQMLGDGFPRKVSDLIQDVWDALNRDRILDSQAVYDDEQSRFLILVGDASRPEGNQLFSYQYMSRTVDRHKQPVGAWERHRITGTAMSMYDGNDGRTKPVLAVPGGVVCKLFEGSDDLGWPVEAVHSTPWIDFGNQSVDKVLDGIDLDCGGKTSSSGLIQVDLYVDFGSGAMAENEYTITTGGGFGPFPIYFGPYGGFLRARGPAIGKFRRIRAKFSHSTVGERIEIGAITFWIHMKSGRYIK